MLSKKLIEDPSMTVVTAGCLWLMGPVGWMIGGTIVGGALAIDATVLAAKGTAAAAKATAKGISATAKALKPRPRPYQAPALPTTEELANEALQRYLQKLRLLENAGLDEIEKRSAGIRLRQQYLRELDQVFK